MQVDQLKRRAFITLLGGVAAWPLAAGAQQADRLRRIGVLMSLAADDPESQARLAAFAQGLQQSGWTIGQNVRVDYRWALNADTMRKYATELVALAPEVILATSSPAVAALQEATRIVPIVFATVIDPVGAGFVESLARPGRNVTGFLLFEYGISGKWLDLLKQIAPGVARAAVLRDPTIASGSGQLGAIQGAAPAFGVELRPVDVRCRGLRARLEWWPDRDRECGSGGSSRPHHRPCGPTPTARDLHAACLRYQRRPNCLWA
jgi:putative ABC transport system substrate-binding protein